MIQLILLLLLIIPLSDTAITQTQACPEAPPPRLLPGMEGVVAPGMVGLHLRSLPAIGTGTVASMNAGTPFTVISGPSCNGGYNWWRVRISGDRIGWAAEATWAEYYLTPAWENPPSGCNRGSNPWAQTFLAPLCYFAHDSN
ncbi:MAG: SH3 domain-containing protein [Anaerolineae bacterium]|nr:SH3 domain-containing protein [Anaerolineae bacterium]